ncbi:methyl-accepting chemotaxis protein [Pseudomonas syringae pv. syringae]|nr:methyl-accepting chemotaxis protein [Pseudomonas syringae pv. syringae]
MGRSIAIAGEPGRGIAGTHRPARTDCPVVRQPVSFREINRSVHQLAAAVESVADEARQSAETSRSLAKPGARLDSLVDQVRV